eukprot:GEZU01018485.1.p1 GENE.GEZU01018485.1~~GEZU01018485.1.p1  ORF type:complete len:324 (+),score=116.27 GEZU01018485.1:28-972(+)
MAFLFIALAIIIAVAIAYIKLYVVPGGKCTYVANLTGKVAIVTGANTGIGKETAKELAKMGATVIVASRDRAKSERAVKDIIEYSNNKNVEYMQLDLADMASIRQFAADFRAKKLPLNILINNAGVMFCPYSKTKDGFEMQFGVNHLGHFLLTNLLLDLLKANKGRIVNVSSIGHSFAPLGGINFDDINSEKSYNAYIAYGQSKMANIMFTRELQRRLGSSGCIATSLHPGNVATELTRHMRLAMIFYPIAKHFLKTPIQGAQTSIYCAIAPDVKPGAYYADCKEAKVLRSVALDDAKQKKLWELSERLVKLRG